MQSGFIDEILKKTIQISRKCRTQTDTDIKIGKNMLQIDTTTTHPIHHIVHQPIGQTSSIGMGDFNIGGFVIVCGHFVDVVVVVVDCVNVVPPMRYMRAKLPLPTHRIDRSAFVT